MFLRGLDVLNEAEHPPAEGKSERVEDIVPGYSGDKPVLEQQAVTISAQVSD